MKAKFFILVFFVFPLISFSQHEQAKATAETMANTFNIQVNNSTGSCFMISKDGMQYFVTAAHLFHPSHKSGDVVPIQMLLQNQLQPFDATIFFHQNRKVDIALFKLSENVSQKIELPEEFIQYSESIQKVFQSRGISLDSIHPMPGMEVLFYGFPLGNLGTEAFGVRFPLVKKAIVSGWVKHNGLSVLVLDGHNNVGFSGGPVVGYDIQSKKMNIIGVISGYVPETIDVEYKGNKLSVKDNSGIIVCYGRHYIEEMFTRHKKDLH